MKLVEMLNKVQELDDALLEIPEELAVDLKDKVDAYVSMMDRLEDDAEKFKKISDFFKAKQKQRESELERFKAYTQKSMESFGWDQLNGEKRKLKIVAQKRFTILREPTLEDFKANPDLVDETISVVHSWNKDKLKAAFESGALKEDFICMDKETKYIRRN